MAEADLLPQLRALRDEIRRTDAQRVELAESRDRLIRRAVAQHTEREIAAAAGVSPGRVNQIAHRR